MATDLTDIDIRKVVAYTATSETPQTITPIGKSLKDPDVLVYGLSAAGVATLLTGWSINTTRDILTVTQVGAFTKVLIIVKTADYQSLNYNRDSSLLPTVLENQLDRLTLSVAWLKDRILHTLRFAETEEDPAVSDLPSLVDRTDTTLGFDTNGNLRVIKDDVYVQQLTDTILTTVSGDLDSAVSASQAAQTAAESEAAASLGSAAASEVSRLASEAALVSLTAEVDDAAASAAASAASAAEAAGYVAAAVTYELSLTSGAPQTFALPTGVANGHRVVVVDVEGNAGTNNITVTSAGVVYIGVATAQSFVLDYDYSSFELMFYNNRWIALGGNLSLT